MSADRPIFYDASGRRDRWSVRFFLAFIVAIVVAAAVFAATLVDVPIPRPLQLAMEHPQPRPLKQQINQLRHRALAWLPGGRIAKPADPIAVGFYVPWDETSRASLMRHIGQLDL